MTETPVEALADRIRVNLAQHGWLQVEERMSVDEFEAVARRLGTTELRFDIVVDPERARIQSEKRINAPARPGVYQLAALDMHTDRPTAGVLAWYCVEPADRGGETLLIDTHDLPEHFSPSELEQLEQIQVVYIVRDPPEEIESTHVAPLLSRRGRNWAIYYVPWLVQQPADEGTGQLLERFRGYVRHKETHGLIPIRLERGESLYIDNRRILHGRGALPEGSRRHLVRLYLRTDH